MAGWTTPRTWVAGEKPPAATMNAHIRDNLMALNGFVRKTADESVTSSTTLQDDNHLLYTIGATGTYVFDIFLIGTSAANGAGDISVAMTFPTGTLSIGGSGATTTLGSGSTATDLVLAADSAATSGVMSSNMSYGLSTSPTMILLKGLLVATATGTLRLQWAQLASNASASTLKAGSYMTVRQVA